MLIIYMYDIDETLYIIILYYRPCWYRLLLPPVLRLIQEVSMRFWRALLNLLTWIHVLVGERLDLLIDTWIPAALLNYGLFDDLAGSGFQLGGLLLTCAAQFTAWIQHALLVVSWWWVLLGFHCILMRFVNTEEANHVVQWIRELQIVFNGFIINVELAASVRGDRSLQVDDHFILGEAPESS